MIFCLLIYGFTIMKIDIKSKNNSVSRTSSNKNYQPSDKEEFMNSRMLEYFREKLIKWRGEVLLSDSQQQELTAEDLDIGIVLESKTRNTHIIHQIDQALQRINNGSYGYCELTGEEISIKRLNASPIAKFTVSAQEMHEEGLI